MNDKHIEMEEAEFFEMTPEELILLKTAVRFALHLLPNNHEDHEPLKALLEKLMRM